MADTGGHVMLLRVVAAGAALLLSTLAPPAQAQTIPSADLMLRADTPELRFRWTVPAETTLEPALFAAMRAEAEAGLAAEEKAAGGDAAEAKKAKYPFRQHLWTQRWSAEAETPALLAFSAKVSGYTGGAHGSAGFATTLFDRAAQSRITFADLFTDPKAAFDALTPGWCEALDAERTARRGDQPNAMFSDCPALAERSLTPMGDDILHTLRVLVEPYVAGPWSEGSYEIAIDPAPALPFLKPQYQSAFAKP